MRVKPMIKVSLVAGALALPGAAWPLGLGRLSVESYVGQPLSARIELLSASKEELDTLSARVADPSLYKQNNLQYQGALSRARVTLERGPGETMYLRVTSPAPITEPYLDLLVEANWAAGRVVRDYTFLLDPPGAPLTSVEAATPAQTGAAPVARARPPAPAAAPATRPAAAAAPSGGAGPAETYEVKRGDTLSKIAKEHKPETATLDQMLVALFKSNADAFDGKNMNRLRSGAIMTIPSAAEVTSSGGTPEEATQTVQVQARDWRAYRDRVAAAAPAVAEEATTRAAGGRIGTTVQERTPAARPGSDELRVSKDGGVARGAAATAENNAAQAAQLREAQSRIADLEKTLKDMQQALALRNPTLAQLQTQGKGATTPPAAAGVAPQAADAPKPAQAVPAEPPKAEPAKASAAEPPQGTQPAPSAPAAAAVGVTDAPKVDATPSAATPEPAKTAAPSEPPKAAEPPKAVEPPKAATKTPPKATAKAPAKEPPGFFDDFLASTPGWAIGAGVLALIAGLVALFAARRRKTTKFEDSIISGTDIKSNTVFGSTGGGVVNTGDNSLASDFSRDGLGNIDTDEVDPIAEAEVYLAYGRDAQAEEILKEALKKDAQRQEIYLKLLEIHAQHNKPSAFETVASELYAVSHGQGEVWQKAVTLGRQLDPANPLFAEGSVAMPRATAAAPGVEAVHIDTPRDPALESRMDEEISISPTSGAKAKSPADILAGAASELEKTARLSTAELGQGPAIPPSSTSASAPRAASTSTLGGAASTLAAAGAALAGAGTVRESAPATPFAETVDAVRDSLHDKVASVGDSIHDKVAAVRDSFDLDFHLDDADKPAPIAKAARGEPVLETVGAAAGVSPAPASSAPAQLTRPSATLELDKLDLEFDPERATFEDPTPSVLDGQWHDAATKLDLAKAYQEMGDVEGAREILQEVLHEGDDQQKAEAKSLLAKIG